MTEDEKQRAIDEHAKKVIEQYEIDKDVEAATKSMQEKFEELDYHPEPKHKEPGTVTQCGEIIEVTDKLGGSHIFKAPNFQALKELSAFKPPAIQIRMPTFEQQKQMAELLEKIASQIVINIEKVTAPLESFQLKQLQNVQEQLQKLLQIPLPQTPQWLKEIAREPYRYFMMPLREELSEEELEPLMPYIEEEFNKYIQENNIDIQVLKFSEFYICNPETDEPLDNSPYKIIFERIKQRAEADSKALVEKLQINTKPDKSLMPLAKPAWLVFNKNLQGYIGSGPFKIKAEAAKDKREINYLCSIDFSDMPPNVIIDKTFTQYDALVYNAVSTLYYFGQTTMSLNQIYYAMGCDAKNINNSDKVKINASLDKMLAAKIMIDNIELHNAYTEKRGYSHYRYEGNLLPLEKISNIALNGQVLKTAIRLLREPPLITVAKMNNNQLTLIPRALLQTPGRTRNSEDLLAIRSYLIGRISRMKGTTQRSRKINFTSLFESTQITSDRQKTRAKEKIEIILNHFKEEHYIKKYQFVKGKDRSGDGILITPE